MSEEIFSVGDTVVFKEWDDMAEEYGLVKQTGSIDCLFRFTREMRHLCGTEHVIRCIVGERFLFGDHDADGYSISADMIKHVDQSSDGFFVDYDKFLSLIQ